MRTERERRLVVVLVIIMAAQVMMTWWYKRRYMERYWPRRRNPSALTRGPCFDDGEQQGGGGDGFEAGESSVGGGDVSQANSANKSTTPTTKKRKSRFSANKSTTPTAKKRKSQFFVDIPEPPSFKVLTEAVVALAKSFKAPEPTPVEPIKLLMDALKALPKMEPELFLRSIDLLGEIDRLMKIFLGLDEDMKVAWLFRKLHQTGL